MKSLFFLLLITLFGAAGLLVYQMYFTQTGNKIQFEVSDQTEHIPNVALILIPTDDVDLVNTAISELGKKIALVVPQNDKKAKIYDIAAKNTCDRLLELNLEPDNLNTDKPNKNTLLVGIGETNNKKRLLSQLSGPFAYDGVIHIKPSVFAKSENDLQFLLREVKSKSFIFVDANITNLLVLKISGKIGSNAKLCDIFLTKEASAQDITNALEVLESTASLNKPALGLFYCTKNVVDSIKEWLEKIKETKTVVLTRLSEI